MSSTVRSDCECAERWRVRQLLRLSRLRVFKRIDKTEIVRDLFRCGCLHDDVGIGVAYGVGRLGESIGRHG